MVDLLVQATFSNLLISTALAAVAGIVQWRVRSPALVNLLWIIVLVKLITPPLFLVPVDELPSLLPPTARQSDLSRRTNLTFSTESAIADIDSPGETDALTVPRTSSERASFLVILAWFTVSAFLFAISTIRILRFHYLLKRSTRIHHNISLGLCADVASHLRIRRCPMLYVTSADLAPFLWWIAGRPIIVVSQRAIDQLCEPDLRLVILHEMVHIKRRDYWCRWLEWFALIGFWWNPVMWLARTQLRVSEEQACDEMVLQLTGRNIDQYAGALLNVAELMTTSTIQPPVVASGITSGGKLETRIKIMLSHKTLRLPTGLKSAIVAMAVCCIPLGIVAAQEIEAVERRLGGAVEAGELTLDQATGMLKALRGFTIPTHVAASCAGFTNEALDCTACHRPAIPQLLAMDARSCLHCHKETQEFEREGSLADLAAESTRKRAENPFEVRLDENLGKHREILGREERYLEFVQKTKAGVAAGELTAEEAEKRILAVRWVMFGESE